MINSLLEHVPLKLEAAENIEEDSDESDTEAEDDISISSDEEAELEAQRIRLPELFGKALLRSEVRALSTASSSSSSVVYVEQTKNQQAQQQQDENEQLQQQHADQIQKKQQTPTKKQQQIQNRKQKEKQPKQTKQKTAKLKEQNAQENNTKKITSRRCQQRKTSDSSTGSTLSRSSSQTDPCGNIFANPELQLFIFNCGFCNVPFDEIHKFSKHLNDVHKMFQNEVVLPEIVVKKELPNLDEFPAEIGASNLVPCGNVFVINRKKLFLSCSSCENKYANLGLLNKHLHQQHQFFSNNLKAVGAAHQVEVKKEVFIITELGTAVETAQQQTYEVAESVSSGAHSPPQPMVTIPNITNINDGFKEMNALPAPAPETPPPEEEEHITNNTVELQDVAAKQTNEETEKPKRKRGRPAVTNPSNNAKRSKSKELVADEPVAANTQVSNLLQSRKSSRRSVKLGEIKKLTKSPATVAPTKSNNLRTRQSIKKTTDVTQQTYTTEVVESVIVTTKSESNISNLNEQTTATTLIVDELKAEDGNKTAAPTVAAINVDLKTEVPNETTDKNSINSQQPPSSPESVESYKATIPIVDILNNEQNIKTEEIDTIKDITKTTRRTYNKKGSAQERFFCDICTKSFKKSSRLAEHRRLHTGEKPYGCDVCGKRFRIKTRLTEHQIRHRKVKAFKCETCGLALATKQDLTLHIRHHTGDRRYRCSVCSKAFVRSSDLKIHVRVHTGEKPYACDICNKLFRANQNLTVHRRSHFGERNFKCELCDKSFMRKIDRKVHMRTHTGEKPFKCEICERGYSSRVYVRAHIQREHMSKDVERKKVGRKPKPKDDQIVADQQSIIKTLQQQLLEKINNHNAQLREHKQEAVELTKEKEELESNSNAILLRTDDNSELETKLENNEQNLRRHLPLQKVSVTLSMQVEKYAAEALPEKENDTSMLANVNTTTATLPTRVKRERKITSYFAIVGQKELNSN